MEAKRRLILDQFLLGELLVATSPDSVLPELYKGVDTRNGANVLIKVWQPHHENEGGDLEAIWRNEVLLLHRLAGYPGGREYLTPMMDAGHDSNGFYLVLKNAQLLILQQPIQKADVSPKSKHYLWSNICRLAKGLGILHAHGMIHRNLGESSIFTNGGESPDYKLGGFEWSIRLRSEEAGENIQPLGDNKTEYYSFNRDWRSFGILAAKILGIDPKNISRFGAAKSDRQGLSLGEHLFLRELIYPEGIDGSLDSKIVVKKIDKLIEQLTRESDSQLYLYLVYDSRDHNYLWNDFIGDEEDKQADRTHLLNNDLAEAVLVKLKQFGSRSSEFEYVLKGDKFVYFLKRYNGKDNWAFATIALIGHGRTYLNVKCSNSIPKDKIKILDVLKVERNASALLPQAHAWDQVIKDVSEDLYPNRDANLRYDAFLFLHLIELLYQTAMTWPIVVRSTTSKGENNYLYEVTFHEDENRTKLFNTLGLGHQNDTPIENLIEALGRTQEDGQGGWQVAENYRIGIKSESDKWKFIKSKEKRDDIYFYFTGSKYFDEEQFLFLKPGGEDSQEALMSRRADLLKSLKNHVELTEVLSAPLDFIRNSHDPEPDLNSDLDPSKEKAFKEILKSLPIYLLQGPPGVGKTHLITALVKECFSADPTTRILISAQGHNAVNHLMSKVCKEIESWPEANRPLVVRSRNRKAKEAAGKFHIRSQALQLLNDVIASPLFSNAPTNLKDNIQKLHSRVVNTDDDSRLSESALESLLLRSANLMFSTVNSADLKDMLDATARFDWSIVEEAGRATGTELLAPLMLSHRRLLIGDPKQLPPFGEDKIKALLRMPDKLRSAIDYGREFLSNFINELGIDDLIKRYDEPIYASSLANEVGKTLLLFESLHKTLYQQQTNLPAAGVLNEQYRMHPDISNLVSRLFYKNPALLTAKKIEQERLSTPKPYTCISQERLPDSPVVFIDMPFKQQGSPDFGEAVPAYFNPKEVKAVLEVLSLLRASPSNHKQPSLAVITPYNEQVNRLSVEISAGIPNKLAHLNDFHIGDKLVHTIDSFQGNEADIVIVSLVRNNERGYRKGLGILADARRMNVLLSRAKWKLVIIGSLGFLNKRFRYGKEIAQDDELRFLKDLVNILKGQKRQSEKGGRTNSDNGIVVVPYNNLINGKPR